MKFNNIITEEQRFYSRLKNHFFSLYEIEQELSAAQYPRKPTITQYNYDEIESLKARQIDKKNLIKNLLDEYKNQEVI